MCEFMLIYDKQTLEGLLTGILEIIEIRNVDKIARSESCHLLVRQES